MDRKQDYQDELWKERAISTTAAVETWRPIAGYEGLYEVSSLGQVRSLDRDIYVQRKDGITYTRHCNSKKIKCYKDRYGYLIVPLKKDGIYHSALLHRIIATAFIPNPYNLPEVNHKDEDKTNNDISNLEWCDHLYNTRYGTGLKRSGMKRSKPVEQMTLDGVHICYHNSIKLAAKSTGFDKNEISKACRCLRDSFNGYRWQYVN